MQGEKIIACVMRSRFTNVWYGQWLLLNVPWRRVEDFDYPALTRVPPEYRNMARVIQCPHAAARHMFSSTSQDAFILDMRQEGRRERYQKT
eukprot:3739702-Karenia_brevis.AAC.2